MARHTTAAFLVPHKDNISLLLQAISLFFKIDIVFSKLKYNQTIFVSSILISHQQSSTTVHVCGYEDEAGEWTFFPLVPPTLMATYSNKLVGKLYNHVGDFLTFTRHLSIA